LLENGRGFNNQLKSLAWVKQDVSEVKISSKGFPIKVSKSQLDPTVMIRG
jgi:hypothetical protein